MTDSQDGSLFYGSPLRWVGRVCIGRIFSEVLAGPVEGVGMLQGDAWLEFVIRRRRFEHHHEYCYSLVAFRSRSPKCSPRSGSVSAALGIQVLSHSDLMI